MSEHSSAPNTSNLAGCIDLHAHTNESDGSLTPAELVHLAVSLGLDALAITDHDTFAGYDRAVPFAQEAGLDLIRGIELNTRLLLPEGTTKNLHLLAYFFAQPPAGEFLTWLRTEQEDRQSRNRQLVESLRNQGVDITLAEVEARGRSLAGRPHFARILVDKGYAANNEDAFNRFIGENGAAYVERQSHTVEEAIRIVRLGGGFPVIAHPIRLNLSREAELEIFSCLKEEGLLGLEVFHSEHSAELQAHYLALAKRLNLLPTGGSDFHGTVKPRVALGTGYGNNIRVPGRFLDDARALVPAALG